MRTRIVAVACAAVLACSTVSPAQAAEAKYQPAAVAPGWTATVEPPLPRGEAWYESEGLPSWATLNTADGSIRLAPGPEVTPGTYEWPVKATFADDTSTVVSARVVVGEIAPETQDGAIIDAVVKYAPQVSQRCSATAIGVGLPLLILLPLGFASQLPLPFAARENQVSLLVGEQFNVNLKLRNLNSPEFDTGIAAGLTLAGLTGAGVILSQCMQ